MTWGVLIALLAGLAACSAAWRWRGLREFVEGFAIGPSDAQTLLRGGRTDADLSRLRQQLGDRAAFESLYEEDRDPWALLDSRNRYQRRKWANILASLPKGRRFKNALDVGCGLGGLSRSLADRAECVLGVDLAQSAVQRAQQLHADRGNIRFMQADAFDLPAEMNGKFDLVVLADILYYKAAGESFDGMAARIAELLLPGGVCIVVNHYFVWDEPTRLSRRIFASLRRAKALHVAATNWRPFYLTMQLVKGGRDVPDNPRLPVMARLRPLALAVAGLCLIAAIGWNDLRPVGAGIVRAGWTLPVIVAIHLTQLFLSAMAWRLLMGGRAPSAFTVFRLRWVREAVNSLLPLAQIGGFLVSVRLATRQGVTMALATASTTLDTLTEAAAQFLLLLICMALLPFVGRSAHVASEIAKIMLLALLAGLGLLVALHQAPRATIKALLARYLPGRALGFLGRLEQEWNILLRNRRRTASATALHLCSWMLGTAEVMVVLAVLGAPVTPGQGLIIESIGTAARSLGFAIPAGLGFQEGGFVLACGLFGIAPEFAIALSMIKRLREVVVGVPGLLFWHRAETKHG
ncbi:MAG TPA: lysylphosphatidylglycerol synthase domain-containing protein [Rhizomicrobium sp.]|nr:lysylphosphatidylglycerol synthase domain-containing protein [Rhizomicrobium sp.]